MPRGRKRKSSETAWDLAARYSWATEYGDHFETSEAAYFDIEPVLRAMGGGTILDPYYCEGATVRRLRKLGFQNVWNPKEDFYQSKVWTTPENFDILCSNPCRNQV